MTSERLFGVLATIHSLDDKLGLQTILEQVRDALNNVVAAPAQPQHQSSLATALSAFGDAAVKMEGSITSSDAAAIKQLGGAEFFDPAIAKRVTTSVQTNAMTPSVARDFVQDLASRRSDFLLTVSAALTSLRELAVTDSALQPGTADAAFLIPRELFGNQLGAFARELTFISRLVQDLTEAQTGHAEPVLLNELSSSVPAVTLMADLVVLGLLGTVINKFLAAWERIERIRRMRAELSEMGLKGIALQQLTDDITNSVKQVIEESTDLALAKYKGNRRNELANAIRGDAKRLFGQIERGLTVEFRAQSAAGENEQANGDLQRIAQISRDLKFPEITNEPLLLSPAEVLGYIDDGEAGAPRGSKKTATQKAGAQKGATPKEGNDPGHDKG